MCGVDLLEEVKVRSIRPCLCWHILLTSNLRQRDLDVLLAGWPNQQGKKKGEEQKGCLDLVPTRFMNWDAFCELGRSLSILYVPIYIIPNLYYHNRYTHTYELFLPL